MRIRRARRFGWGGDIRLYGTGVPGSLLDRLRAAPAARPVLAALEPESGVWVVGGAVRDVALGRAPAELDVVVEGDAAAVARRAAARLGGEAVVHARFGTATVRARGAAFDLAGTRAEAYPRPGALPEVRLGVPLAQDLARRDFTVNTLAVAPGDGREASWAGAREDLDAGVLRVLHPGSFADDPTRLLRLARYQGRLGFAPDPRTTTLARDAVAGGALATVSGARLGAELRRLAREPQPAGWAALAASGAGAALLGDFAVDEAFLRRALGECPPDARADLLGLAAVWRADPGRLAALAFTAPERAVLLACSRWPEVVAALGATRSPSDVRRVLRTAPPELAALAAAGGAGAARRWLAEWRHARPAVDGRDLLAAGLRGPAIGAGLEAATDALLDGRAPDRDAQLGAALAAAAPDRA